MNRLNAVSRGIIGAWALVVAEVAILTVAFHERLTSTWEVRTGFGLHLPAWLLLSVPSGVAAGFLAQALIDLKMNPRGNSRMVSAGWFALFSGVVAWGVGGGRHLSTLEARGGFSLVIAALVGTAIYILLPRVARLATFSTSRRAGPLFIATLVGACAVFEAVNLLVLVRLYPAFHAGLSLLALTCAGTAFALSFGGGSDRSDAPAVSGILRHTGKGLLDFAQYGVGAVIACAAFVFVPASKGVSGFDNVRWIIAEGSPTLNWGVRAASAVAPPAEVDEQLAQLPLGERRPARGVDFRGRDILLISIDALRADHLGAYGYKLPTSPALDALAKEGVLFEAAYAPTPHTSYSITSLMTGKYMRPLLLQGAGADSDLWATLLQSYSYRTAAFYPPAVFFIDPTKFDGFNKSRLGFEYAKVEFAEGETRVGQVRSYLKSVPADRQVFSWVHLFGPHEPYEAHKRHDFGQRDIDRYDSEVRAADETVAALVELARMRDPNTLIIVTADHGEEFGDHGGRYHGTSVFDEQVRVPLLIAGTGLAQGRVVKEPVQTIDLLPTVLDGLRIPTPPRVRGRPLTHFLQKVPTNVESGLGRAVAETDDYSLLAEGSFRLICQRRSGACQLFDIEADPRQQKDVSTQHAKRASDMKTTAHSIAQTHGTYESQGLRAEGKGWPGAILVGISGSAEVAPTLATLLDDADAAVRGKAAELLFELGTSAQAPALRLAMTREEDVKNRAWIALALTRLGQGAPLVYELLGGRDLANSRLAALALAEAGKDDGEEVLVNWWAQEKHLDFALARRILRAFSKIRSKKSVPHLIATLPDVRLRPEIAPVLASIGDKEALPHLALQLATERYQTARLPLATAVMDLGGDTELIAPLRLFLGVPDQLPGGLGIAERAGILSELGGPKEPERLRLQQLSDSGIQLEVVVPPAPDKAREVRLIVRCRSTSGQPGVVLVEPASLRSVLKKGDTRVENQPDISESRALKLNVPKWEPGPAPAPEAVEYIELSAVLPASFGARPGFPLSFKIFAPGDIEISSVAALPLRDDLPPPPPVPWRPKESENTEENAAPKL